MQGLGRANRIGVKPLGAERLYRRVAPDTLGFAHLGELTPHQGPIGQDRALEALSFGLGMRHAGYNIFVLAPAGANPHAAARDMLSEAARALPAPPDWIYVNNFADVHRPRALRLPAGEGPPFAARMEKAVGNLGPMLRGVFESEEYVRQRREAEERVHARADEAIARLHSEAESRGTRILQTAEGLFVTIVRDGRPLEAEELDALPEPDRAEARRAIGRTERSVQDVLDLLPRLEGELGETIGALNRAFANHVVTEVMKPLRTAYGSAGSVVDHLDAMAADILDHLGHFVEEIEAGGAEGLHHLQADIESRYAVNVLVSNDPRGGAPVLTEDHPALSNLVGKVEHRAEMGMMVTDVGLIRPGSLHAANGGVLLVDAERLLSHPLAYDALKRALQDRRLRIETQSEFLAMGSTVTLEPDAIPLDVKLVLIGEPWLYYGLSQQDPDFAQLFKVQADFADDMPRTVDSEKLYARMLAGVARADGLAPFDAGATARLIEQAARLADDAEKLSLLTGEIADLAREAENCAASAGASVVRAEHVRTAIAARIRRADLLREQVHDSILEEVRLIDTDGSRVGQVNGLVVYSLPNLRFGAPARITARIRANPGAQVLDIERQAQLGGPRHTKGVMILSSYLLAHYSVDRPAGFAATLAFEQSYGKTDGDSASAAELFALVSALADVPLSQSMAVTGSVNQFGEIQAIGGVNEKIEGFFDICKARGLTGRQGVIVPVANVRHLMLREEILEAVRAGRFSVHAIATVEEGLEVLTGMRAGERAKGGRFPKGTLNAKVEARLAAFAEAARTQGGAKARRSPWSVF
ncbi:MAG: AAA family ATPase [Alphaproteobacteria bacterium]|nr:AAA family ATPase [Alphaproteobacteria bacterium]